MFICVQPIWFMLLVTLSVRCTVQAIQVTGRSLNITEGDDALLLCQLHDTKETVISITWQRRTRDQPINTDFFVDSTVPRDKSNTLPDRVEFKGDFSKYNGSIRLKNVRYSDDGLYTCIFNIFPSGPYETRINVDVIVPPVMSVETEVFPVAGVSEPVVLAVCTAAESQPASEVSWNLDALNGSVKVENRITEDPKGTFTVKSSLLGLASRELNQQKVQCLVSHVALKKTRVLDYALNIHYPPQAVSVLLGGEQGEACKFHCDSDGNPKPINFTWSRNISWTQIVCGSFENGTLVIKRTLESKGLYICQATNQYGNSRSSLYVDIITENQKTCWILFGLFTSGTVVVLVGVYFMRTKLRNLLWSDSYPERSSPRSKIPEDNSGSLLMGQQINLSAEAVPCRGGEA